MIKKKSVSIVIPAYNECENLKELIPEIATVLTGSGIRYEILIVNDGSIDGTSDLHFKVPNVQLINFRRNYGQTAAMQAGIDASQYEYVAFLDADGQNNPADIPKMLTKLILENLDAVCGWRRNRMDSKPKKLISRGAAILRKLLIKGVVHDSGCTLKIIRREPAKELRLYGELHRFIPEMLYMLGFSIDEVEVDHRSRRYGETKYTWRRIIRGYLDMLGIWFWNRYSFRPLHALGALSGIFFVLGSTAFTLAAASYLYFDEYFTKFLPTVGIMFWLFSIQFLLSGLLADTLVKSNLRNQNILPYSIKTKRAVNKI